MAQKKFEDALVRLEEIVEKMESGELSLDDALKYYEEGIMLTRLCYKRLNEAEMKIEKLAKKKGPSGKMEFETEEMDVPDDQSKA